MGLHQLQKIVRKHKTLGRGHGKRGGKSGKGQKGQKSRAGYSRKAGFEGGQTPLYMRFPKGRGSKQKFLPQMEKLVALPVSFLNHFEAGTIVGPGVLRKAGLLPTRFSKVKFIGTSTIDRKLTVRTHAVTSGAQKAIEAVGGKVELISL